MAAEIFSLFRRISEIIVLTLQSVADPQTVDITTGVSTIKVFNISNVTTSAYQHPRDGLLLGW